MARPKEFDRQEALKKALIVFWTKGYDSSSISDLTAAMGISRSSLYETFGDKQGLFIEAMDSYSQMTSFKKNQIFNASISVKHGMRDYLSDRVDTALNEDYPGGCFFTNTATSLETADDRVKTAIKLSSGKLENELYLFIESGKLTGEIGENKNCRMLARFFTAVVSGINVISRVQKDRSIFDDIINVALEVLD